MPEDSDNTQPEAEVSQGDMEAEPEAQPVDETMQEAAEEAPAQEPETVEEAPKVEAEPEKQEAPEPKKEEKSEEKSDEEKAEEEPPTRIFGLRTTANREDQVMDFLSSRLAKNPEFGVYSVIRAHGMRGYIFVEARDRIGAEAAVNKVPYSRGILPNEIKYKEIEHLLEQVKVEYNIRKNDIVELISGPFKRESAKVTRIDKTKEEVVVELLNAAIPIPITVKMDTVKVIRRESDEAEN